LLFFFIANKSFAKSYCSNSKGNLEFENVNDFDEAEIYNAFTEINDLINYVSANDSVTYSDLQEENNSLLLLHDTDPDIAFNHTEKFSFNNQTSFLAGCLFGVVGIVAVAVINNGDQERLSSSIWGCVASGCISVGGVIALFVFNFAAFSGFYY